MSLPTIRQLRAALSRDLMGPDSKKPVKVVDDSARGVFTTNRDGAVFVFSHKQPNPSLWVGMKHYASGPTSRIRMRRSQTQAAALEASVTE